MSGGAALEPGPALGKAANLTSHMSKYRSLMPSLALLFHLIDVVSGTRRGRCPCARRCDRRPGAIPRRARPADVSGRVRWRSRARHRLAERIKSGLRSPFKVRDVFNKGWKGLGTREEIDRAVGCSRNTAGWYARTVPTPGIGGRPPRSFTSTPRSSTGVRGFELPGRIPGGRARPFKKLRNPMEGHLQNRRNPLRSRSTHGFPPFDSLPGTDDLKRARAWSQSTTR